MHRNYVENTELAAIKSIRPYRKLRAQADNTHQDYQVNDRECTFLRRNLPGKSTGLLGNGSTLRVEEEGKVSCIQPWEIDFMPAARETSRTVRVASAKSNVFERFMKNSGCQEEK